MKGRSQLIIIGGFLGSGKTTLLATTSRLLQSEGKKVGLITNDQAEGLVDTFLLSGNGMNVQEIAGSCFCCNFEGLMEAALYLRDREAEIIIAEPVGSCTDLSATLLQPIKAYYQKFFELTPLSVLVDPLRLQKVIRDEKTGHEDSNYIYMKQLEEADRLVINKTDLLDDNAQTKLEKQLATRFPDYPVSWISALHQKDITVWLEKILSDSHVGRRIPEVNYDRYAREEALMGWYNASFLIKNIEGLLIPWKEFNEKFLQLLQHVFKSEEISIGHIKTYLKGGPSYLQGNLTDVYGGVSVIGAGFSSTLARMVVNVRAETSPYLLKEILDEIIQAYEEHHILFETIERKFLSPGRPKPTFRFNQVIE